MNQPVFSGKAGQLQWEVYENRQLMGDAAAELMAGKIRSLFEQKAEVNVIFASAPSQNDLLASLGSIGGLDWSRINAFHMDEYIGLDPEAPQNFSIYLRDGIFRRVTPGKTFYINGSADPDQECLRYSQLLREYPVDICCLGIGENGHLAFNDPHVADFNDPLLIKKVAIDDISRMQQVHDGNFQRMEDVPKIALSLTIPALLRAQYSIAVVPGPTKTQAVYRTLYDPISEACPATVLRRQSNAYLFLDRASGAMIKQA